jgi:hypothetical protein
MYSALFTTSLRHTYTAPHIYMLRCTESIHTHTHTHIHTHAREIECRNIYVYMRDSEWERERERDLTVPQRAHSIENTFYRTYSIENTFYREHSEWMSAWERPENAACVANVLLMCCSCVANERPESAAAGAERACSLDHSRTLSKGLKSQSSSIFTSVKRDLI